jgi:serine/threonine-protein kinase
MTVCRLCSTEHSPGEINCPSAKLSARVDPQDLGFAATDVAAPAALAATAAPAVAATSTYLRKPSATAGPLSDVSDELPVGTVIGYWTITRKLGEGGMGAVYAATAEDIGTTVAVKVLSFPGWRKPEAQAPFDNAKERFHREAKAASKLKHPNVIGILAYGSLPDGRPYFVMEYLPGRSLDARLLEAPPRGAELLRLLSHVCDALAAIHLEGIVHRDLKPENIWIVEPKQGETSVKLLDFGISKMEGMAKLTETGAHAGTVYYESPEQLDGKNIGPRSDIYSFGAVLFEMFTGHLLFGEQSLAKTFHDILFAEPPPLMARAPYSISPELGRLILDCLRKKPEERPQ